jgi:hypothetical protein
VQTLRTLKAVVIASATKSLFPLMAVSCCSHRIDLKHLSPLPSRSAPLNRGGRWTLGHPTLDPPQQLGRLIRAEHPADRRVRHQLSRRRVELVALAELCAVIDPSHGRFKASQQQIPGILDHDAKQASGGIDTSNVIALDPGRWTDEHRKIDVRAFTWPHSNASA